MLLTILWMALAASGGVLSGILFDKLVKPVTPLLPEYRDKVGAIDFMRSIKLIGILTVGALALHLIMKVFKIKFFNKVIK